MDRLIAVSTVVAVAGLLAACSVGNAPATSTIPVTPTPTPTVAATPTLAPTPAATPTIAPATVGPLRMGTLDAGQYRTNSFEPQLILTLPAGWSQFFPDEDDEIYMGTTDAELAISRPAQVRDPDSGQPEDTPDDLLAWLVEHPSLGVDSSTPVEIDGIDSAYVEVSPTQDVRVFVFAGGDFRLIAGGESRVYVIPMDGPDIAVSVLAPAGGTLADALTAAAPVVESLEIGP